MTWKNDPWPSIFVAAFEGFAGPSHRKIGFGDLLRSDEVGNGIEHGRVIKLPSDRGLVALTRAAVARVEALEDLLVNGSDDEIAAEAAEIAKAKGRAA